MKLEQQLQQIRSRYGRQLFLRTLLLTVAVACGVTGFSWFLATFSSRSFAPLPFLAVLLAAGLLLSALRAWRATPSLQQTARLLENRRSLGLSERLSTALEIKAHGEQSALHHALLEDAGSAAARLQPQKLIPLRIPRQLLALLGAGGILLLSAVFLNGPLADRQATIRSAAVQSPAVPSEAAAPEFTAEERTTLAGNLQQIAEAFAQQADETQDPYLQAISRELQEVSRQLEGQGLSRAELSSQLERLLEHAQSALQPDQSEGADDMSASSSPSLPELLEAALREVNRDAAALAQAENGQGEADETGVGAADQTDAAAAAAGEAQPLSLEELLSGQRAEYEGAADSAEVGGKPGGDGYTSNAGLDTDAMRELDERAQAAQQAAGEVIGASADSTKGASSLAGEGTQELFGDEEATAQSGGLEQVMLPDEADPDGRHTRIEAAPDVNATEIFETSLGAVNWVRNREPAASREPITSALRQITARYHSPEGERR